MKTWNLQSIGQLHRNGIRRIAVGLLALAALLLVGTVLAAGAQNHINVTTGLTLAKAPLAIHGYDPVAYFTEGRARVGKASFTAVYDGAAFRFVSQENKEAFEKNPEQYAPQFGGFCAFGVSVGAKFDGDPTLWKIVNNKLYFNLNPDIQAMWLKDVPGNIAKADQNWTRIQDKAPVDLK